MGENISKVFKNIEAVEKDLSFNPGARAAFNIAIHDVYCKHTNISLGGLLGQKTPPLPRSVTVGIKSATETIAEIEEYLADGFKNIKIKLGEEVEKDIERMLKVQERFGNYIVVRIDANQAWSFEETLAFVGAVVRCCRRAGYRILLASLLNFFYLSYLSSLFPVSSLFFFFF